MLAILQNMVEIVRDNWLLLLIGQYPNGPLGGIAATLILSILGITLAFPLSVVMALAGMSQWRGLRWPVLALIYIALTLIADLLNAVLDPRLRSA